MSTNKRIVLAYSGGLDTSVICKWLQETYESEVVTFTADIGQGEEVEPARAKAQSLGVERIFIEDLVRDSLYSVVVHTTDRCSFSASFRTAPRRSRVIRFGATSCLGGNRPWPSLSVAAQQKYDFFCFLGDSVYADGSDTKPESNGQQHGKTA